MKTIKVSSVFIFVIFSIFFGLNSAMVYSQEFSDKTIKMYEKGVKSLNNGSTAKAEKKFWKILDSEEYGRCYYQLAVIELDKDNKTTAYAYFNKAKGLLEEEINYYKDKPGYTSEMNDVEAVMKSVQQGIVACGGAQALQPEVPVEIDEDSNTEDVNKDSSDSNKKNLSYDKDLITIQTTPEFQILFYNNGAMTTYYSYNDKPLLSYRLPTPDELEAILSYLLESDDGGSILTKLDWEENGNLRFISNVTYYDDQNEHLNKGYSISRNKKILKGANIELGDSVSVLLIKK